MDLITTKRRLLSAVCVLGAAEGTVDQRLRLAYQEHLNGLSLNAGLPAHIHRDCVTLMQEVADFLSVRESAGRTSASSLAKRVVVLYDRIVKEL